MRPLRALLNSILASVGGSLAGGAAGGATMMIVSGFPAVWEPHPVANIALGFVFFLWAVLTMAFLGLLGGILFGFISTLILGTILSLIRRWPPFGSWLVWATAGGLAGLAIHFWGPFGVPSTAKTLREIAAWGAAWTVGGAAAMSVYWTAAGIFASGKTVIDVPSESSL